MTEKTTTETIRAWAASLPEVTEKQHFRFKVPVWQVRGKTFLGMGRDETTAVFCITEAAAEARATADPAHATPVRRQDARRSFLGLEVQLNAVSPKLLHDLVHEAWAAHAPKTLAKRHREAP
ncbi:MAG TPA: MmcQ/YjbR family DNA-binding protein [Streptosporangiaceae bacterium]|nr:MmcQ/YjbR family DNA-binding protein [Streptosporangiaceae bacterium]